MKIKYLDKKEKAQTLYILLGLFLSAVVAIFVNLVLTQVSSIPIWINRMGIYGLLFFVITTAYAIVKHHLFNIKVVAAEVFSGLIILIFLGNTLLAQTLIEFLWKFGLFVGVAVFSILLVRSVLNEVRAREELAKMARRLKRANVELRRLDQTKSEFFSIASHQLRTPLSIIKGFLSMILEGFYGEVSPDVQDKLKKSAESNERLIRLVNDLLNISRAERGKLKFKFQIVSLRQIIKSAAGGLEKQAKKKGLDFIYKIPKGEDKFLVRADKAKLREVIDSLIDNAIKYTTRGKIEMGVRRLDGRVAFYVKDTGIGFSEEDKKRLFTKFSRGRKVSRIWTEGVGLGLYVARLIIEAHRGKIFARSKGEGKGSEFWVKLPGVDNKKYKNE